MRDKIILSLVLLSSYTFTGCSVEKRCVRFFERNPQCFQGGDTIVQYDTIIQESVKYDTTLVQSGDMDTFYIEKDKVRTQIIRVRDTLRVTTTVAQDTNIVPRYTIRTIPKPIVRYRIPSWVWYLLCSMAGAIIVLWLIYQRSK